MKGIKHDTGKPKMNLLVMEFIEEMARVLTEGAKKYDAWNWKELDNDRVHNALLRHAVKTTANKQVENNDDFGGLEEVYTAVNCMFLWTLKRDKEKHNAYMENEKIKKENENKKVFGGC